MKSSKSFTSKAPSKKKLVGVASDMLVLYDQIANKGPFSACMVIRQWVYGMPSFGIAKRYNPDHLILLQMNR